MLSRWHSSSASKFVKYASQDLLSLENKFQTLSGDVINLEWKKKQCQDESAILSSTISRLKRSLDTLQTAIEYKKQILVGWDDKVNEMIASIHSDKI